MTLEISIPDSLKSFIEEQTQSGAYRNAGEYLSALIREDQERKAKERIEHLLLEGVDSGQAVEMTSAGWQEARQEVLQQLENE
jgi:antitoxin ParD1/3/4